ncbi:interleukin-1 receptor type 2 isoform X1 [Ctenopharyngodon idella]|uniref:interleukin-1 receptor type 2 isoform X1 n=1 Tax=Ctenopharyngodon idella TaxID=7959 RepID=UPI0022320E28|nr:interleukin-1 receptor type 2 isoform X1 [Ctenopharyngodon idella]
MIIHRQRLFDFGTYIVILSMRSFLNSALALKGSCVVVGPEIPEYQVQGEAVIIRFPFLEDAINYRKLQVDNSSTFHIDHINLRNQSNLKSCRDRVKQSGRGVQLLPSHPSDSGTFTYTLRSNTFCLTGSISVTVYEAEEPNTMMTYNARVGEDTKINCPHLRYFKRKENLMWYKDFQSTALPVGRGQYTIERGIILSIKNMSVKDQGFYTCRLNVIFNNTRYNVSRTWRVQVSAPVSESAAPEVVTSNNLNAFTSSGYSFPYIVFPVNGSFIESHFGSRLAISCVVRVGNQSAQSTDVTWLVNGQPVENSHLGARAFLTDKSITGNHLEVQLVILELQQEDNWTELKCICQNQDQKQEVVTQIKLEDSEPLWMVIAAISSCFILVVCVFLYHLCQKPKKRGDYIQAQQDSTI